MSNLEASSPGDEATTPTGVRGLKRRLALILAGLALCIYFFVLLTTTHLAQQRLVESAQARQALELRLRASALSYFYAERRGDLDNLRASRVISTFFANRDLGMSMEYGLRASLEAIRDLTKHLLEKRRVGERSMYLRIALLDTDGSILIDSDAAEGTAIAWAALPAEDTGKARVLADSTRHPEAVIVQAPVVVAGRMRGTLLAWVDEQAALTALVGLDPAGIEMGRYRVLRLGQAMPSDLLPQAASLPVPETPFLLLDISQVRAEGGILTSRWFIAGLALVALALLAGGALLLRFHSQNLVLQTRMEAARRQRIQLTRHNALLLREIARREESERRLMYQSHYDGLTGLPNRALALDRLAQALKLAIREGQAVLVLYLDLDHFKRINDSLGHDAGDALLRQVAERIKEVIADGDSLARLAADEFLFIAPDLPERGPAELQAQRILNLFETPFVIEGREIPLTACVGSATGPRDGETADELLKHADMAMKQAKAVGQGSYRAYQHGLDQRARETLEIATLLRRAAERDELRLFFQPLVDLRSGRAVAAEALLRWNSAELGPISPARFIPIAEEAGLIRQLGAWVLEQACAAAVEWQTVAPCRVAVNVSSLQLQMPDEFRACVERSLAKTGLSPALLELEITEGVLLADRPDIAALLAELDGIGVHLSLDDFGTGYSALSYLRRFPFRVLKIDRSFIAGVPGSPEDVELTRAIVAMAQALGLTVLAEGVEEIEQVDFLMDSGCDLAQGYHFGRPMPSESFMAYLANERPVRGVRSGSQA